MHSASFLSQSFSFSEQASTSEPQNGPENDDAHVHENLFTWSVHVEPFWHGDDAHSSSFTSQL
jgi:hypothetical protein